MIDNATPLKKIAIGICTCERPEGLARLLAAIDRLRLPAMDDQQIEIILVDNSATAYARPAAQRYAQNGRFEVAYRHEPRRGLSIARNRVLKTAREIGADYVASIDDDEAPHPDWLQTLVDTRAAAGTTLVIGPVRPVFEAPPPRWLPASAYETRGRPQNGIVTEGYTCNALIDVRALDSTGIEFDRRFDKSGAEDTAFFMALTRAGHQIAWAEDAVVYETVPRARMTLKWLIRRWYLTGLNQGRIAADASPGAIGAARNLSRGLIRLVAGIGRIGASAVTRGWSRPDRVVLASYTAARGIGYMAAAFGGSAQTYAGAGYR